jgi:hypothetical protein
MSFAVFAGRCSGGLLQGTGMMKRGVFSHCFAVASLMIAMIYPALGADRVALVIGCGKYRAPGVPELSTPVNDAQKMAVALRKAPLSFDVVEGADASRNQFFEKLDEFRTRARGAKVVMVYFSGHGIEAEGVNYLIPVDAVLEKPSHLESETIPLMRILDTMQSTGAEAKVAVLDACRDNPFGRTKSWRNAAGKSVADGVLAALGDAQLPEATLICYAAAPGRKAAAVLNDDSQNSPLTEFLLKRLATPGARLRDVFEATADDVAQATKNHQLPYVKYDGSASVLRQLVLAPAPAVASASSASPPAPVPAATVPPVATPPAKPAMETARLDVVKPPVPPAGTVTVPKVNVAGASGAEAIALFPPHNLAALPFQYFVAPGVKAPVVKKIALKQISQTKSDASLVGEGEDQYKVPATAKTQGTNWIKGTHPLPAGFPLTFQDHTLIRAIPNSDSTVLLYHAFPEAPRYLVAVDGVSGKPTVAFDFEKSIFAPKTKDRQFARQGVTWAVQEGDILYMARGHNGYAKDAGGQTGYLFAWSIPEQKVLWNSQPVVCNSDNFVIVGDVIICGYGFTDEPDFLYQINRWTGAVLDTMKMRTGPEYFVRKAGKLHVRTYDSHIVFDCPEN